MECVAILIDTNLLKIPKFVQRDENYYASHKQYQNNFILECM